MSIESASLIDAVFSARLASAGLPALANVQAAQTGVTPSSDPYAAPSSSLTTLSGYGQLLSATSRAAEQLKAITGSNANIASSSSASVATASATSAASAGSYAVTVTQVAQSQVLKSGVFSSPTAQILSAGTFSIGVGSNTPVEVTIGEGTGLIGGVSYPWGSLNGIAVAINSAGAGVTASVESGSYGYNLKLQAADTGASNTIAITASTGDPFSPLGTNMATLGLTQTQAGQNASYTINGVAGSSTSNSSISLATGASFSIVGTGSATITVSSTPFVEATASSVSAAASQMVQSYNALMGTAAQLIGSSGALNGDTTTATPLSNSLYSYTQGANKTYANNGSSLTTLEDLGITGTGSTTGALSLNTTTLLSKNTAEAASLLTTVANTLHSLISGYLGTSGTILTQAKTTEQNMAFLNGQAASSYANLSANIKQYVLQKSLASASVATGLPEISVFT